MHPAETILAPTQQNAIALIEDFVHSGKPTANLIRPTWLRHHDPSENLGSIPRLWRSPHPIYLSLRSNNSAANIDATLFARSPQPSHRVLVRPSHLIGFSSRLGFSIRSDPMDPSCRAFSLWTLHKIYRDFPTPTATHPEPNPPLHRHTVLHRGRSSGPVCRRNHSGSSQAVRRTTSRPHAAATTTAQSKARPAISPTRFQRIGNTRRRLILDLIKRLLGPHKQGSISHGRGRDDSSINLIDGDPLNLFSGFHDSHFSIL